MYFREFEQLAESRVPEIKPEAIDRVDDYLARLSLGQAQNIVPWKVARDTGLGMDDVLRILITEANTTHLLRMFFCLECPVDGGAIELDESYDLDGSLEAIPDEVECDVCDSLHSKDDCLVLRFHRCRIPSVTSTPLAHPVKYPVLQDSGHADLNTLAAIKSNDAIGKLLETAISPANNVTVQVFQEGSVCNLSSTPKQDVRQIQLGDKSAYVESAKQSVIQTGDKNTSDFQVIENWEQVQQIIREIKNDLVQYARSNNLDAKELSAPLDEVLEEKQPTCGKLKQAFTRIGTCLAVAGTTLSNLDAIAAKVNQLVELAGPLFK